MLATWQWLALWASAVSGIWFAGHMAHIKTLSAFGRQLRFAWATNWTLVAAGWWLAGYDVVRASLYSGLIMAFSPLTAAALFIGGAMIQRQITGYLLSLVLAAGGLGFITLLLFVLDVRVRV